MYIAISTWINSMAGIEEHTIKETIIYISPMRTKTDLCDKPVILHIGHHSVKGRGETVLTRRHLEH